MRQKKSLLELNIGSSITSVHPKRLLGWTSKNKTQYPESRGGERALVRLGGPGWLTGSYAYQPGIFQLYLGFSRAHWTFSCPVLPPLSCSTGAEFFRMLWVWTITCFESRKEFFLLGQTDLDLMVFFSFPAASWRPSWVERNRTWKYNIRKGKTVKLVTTCSQWLVWIKAKRATS